MASEADCPRCHRPQHPIRLTQGMRCIDNMHQVCWFGDLLDIYFELLMFFIIIGEE